MTRKNRTANIQLHDNRITLFYFFNHHCPVDSLKSSALVDESPLHTNPKQTQLLWQNHAYNLSKDFIPPIHDLFHKHPDAAIQTWQLEKQQQRKLNQCKLILVPGKTSQQRLQQEHSQPIICLNIERLLHHRFKTGFSVASLELRVVIDQQQPDIQQLTESLYALSRLNKISIKNNKTPLTLGQIIRQLHGEETTGSKKTDRVYSHAYIQIKNNPTPLNETHLRSIITQLSFHYTSDYQPKDTIDRLEFIQDYNNIMHGLAQEGSAAVVQINESSPELLKDYKNKVIRPVHLPIHLLSFHLEHALHQYQRLVHQWTDDPSDHKNKAKQLSAAEHQLLNFKLNFFYPVISHINSHNQLQKKLNKVKQLEAQHAQLGQNIETLNQLIKHHHQSRYCRIASFGIAAAGYLTSFSIIKEGLESLHEWEKLAEIAPHLSELIHHFPNSISLAGSLAITLAILIIVYRHCKHSDHHHHGAAHHALEALHKRHPLEK